VQTAPGAPQNKTTRPDEASGKVDAFGDAKHYGDATGTDPFMLAAVPS
jgi:hypothetical protein